MKKETRFVACCLALWLFLPTLLWAASPEEADLELSTLIAALDRHPAENGDQRARISELIDIRKAGGIVSGAVEDVVVDGEAEVLIVDNIDAEGRLSTSSVRHHLKTSQGYLRLFHLDGVPKDFARGRTLKVRGLQTEKHLLVEGLEFYDPTAAELAAEAVETCSSQGPQRGIVIAVNYRDDTYEDAPLSVIDASFLGATDSLADYWDQTSYGKTSLSGDSFGWVTLKTKSAHACRDILDLRDDAIKAVADLTDLSQYNRIFIAMRPPSDTTYCTWSGVAGGGTTYTYRDGRIMEACTTSWIKANHYTMPIETQLYINAHEGGHNLHFAHAATRDYGTEAIGPIGGAYLGSVNYTGDRYDVMGYNGRPGQYNAAQKTRNGWLTEADYLKVRSSGVYAIEPLSAPLTGIKALRLFRGFDIDYYLQTGNLDRAREHFWIETRQPTGYDQYIDARGYDGAMIRHQSAINNPGLPDLIDLHPETSDFYDSPLYLGEIFTDPYTGISLTPIAVDVNGSLTIDIAFDPAAVDSDEDGIPDVTETLYGTNPDLDDSDGDGLHDIGEVCYDGDCTTYFPLPVGGDADALNADGDNDGLLDGNDNCPTVFNPDQLDSNGDGRGDACPPPDGDGDGVSDYFDNCPLTPNADQTDGDGDGIGDVCDAPVITTTELPQAALDFPYSATLAAAYGPSPYTWSVIGGSLPDGLFLDGATGEVSGSPTALGTSLFTVQVTDAGGASATQDLSIEVVDGSVWFYRDLWIDNYAEDIDITASGDIYVTGRTVDWAASVNFVVKYSNSGDLLFSQHLPTQTNARVTALPDGGFAVAGNTTSPVDVVVARYDAQGNEVWRKVHDGGGNDYAYAITSDAEGNIYVAGSSSHIGTTDIDILILKYTMKGQRKWAELYDGGSSDLDAGYGIDVDNLGNVYATGFSRIASNYDYTTLKYNSRGTLQWALNFDSGGYDSAQDIVVDATGSIHVTGMYSTLKYDSSGTLLWVRDDLAANGMELDSAGNIYLVGSVSLDGNTDIRTTVLNSSGLTVRSESFDGGYTDSGKAVAVDPLGNFFVVGTSYREWGSDVVTIAYPSTLVNTPQ